MRKIIIFLITLQPFLLGSFLSINPPQFKTIEDKFGKKAVQRVKYIQQEFEKINLEDFSYTKMYMVNTLLNKLLYKKDKVHWKTDRNATLLEFIVSGAGDSLDFAAAKYVTLVNLGFDKSRFKFFKTDIMGLSRTKFDTKNYYVLGYNPKDTNSYVMLDCYTDKIMPVFRENIIKYKASHIPYKEKLKMEEDMLKIHFVQNHQFLQVSVKN